MSEREGLPLAGGCGDGEGKSDGGAGAKSSSATASSSALLCVGLTGINMELGLRGASASATLTGTISAIDGDPVRKSIVCGPASIGWRGEREKEAELKDIRFSESRLWSSGDGEVGRMNGMGSRFAFECGDGGRLSSSPGRLSGDWGGGEGLSCALMIRLASWD